MRRTIAVTTLLLLVLGTSPARAASFTFDLVHDGFSSSLVPGSDDPLFQALLPGDSFTYTVHAAGDSLWQVTSTHNFFAALFVLGGGTRTGDWTATFSLNGSVVASASIFSVASSSVHVGNTVSLLSGTTFDELVITYALLGSTSPTTIIQSRELLLPLAELSNVSFVAAPEPHVLSLFLLGLGLARRHTRGRRGPRG